MKKTIYCLLFSVALMSCSTDENQISEDQFLLVPEYGKDFTFKADDNIVNKQDNLQLIEVIIEIGRVSRECGSIGICDFKVCVPGCKQNSNSLKSKNIKFQFNYSDFGNKSTSKVNSLVLLLEKPLETLFDSNFYVDNDLIESSFSISEGIYKLDMSLGEFGGYKIPLTIN